MTRAELTAAVEASSKAHAALEEYKKRFQPFTCVMVDDARVTGWGCIIQDPHCPVHQLPIQFDNGVVRYIDLTSISQ